MEPDREQAPSVEQFAESRQTGSSEAYWEDEWMRFAWSPDQKCDEPIDNEPASTAAPQLAASEF